MYLITMLASIFFSLAGLVTEDKELKEAFAGLAGILFLVALIFGAMNL